MSKPWYKSATIIGALVYSLIGEAETQGVVPAGAVAALANLLQAGAGVFGVFGLRRAIGS